MIDGEEKIVNSYERLKYINSKIAPLENQEKELKEMIRKSINLKNNRFKLSEVETEIMFLVFEKNILENCIKWFEIYYLGYIEGKNVQRTKDFALTGNGVKE